MNTVKTAKDSASRDTLQEHGYEPIWCFIKTHSSEDDSSTMCGSAVIGWFPGTATYSGSRPSIFGAIPSVQHRYPGRSITGRVGKAPVDGAASEGEREPHSGTHDWRHAERWQGTQLETADDADCPSGWARRYSDANQPPLGYAWPAMAWQPVREEDTNNTDLQTGGCISLMHYFGGCRSSCSIYLKTG